MGTTESRTTQNMQQQGEFKAQAISGSADEIATKLQALFDRGAIARLQTIIPVAQGQAPQPGQPQSHQGSVGGGLRDPAGAAAGEPEVGGSTGTSAVWLDCRRSRSFLYEQ